MDELRELLRQIRALDGVTDETFATALREEAQPLYQFVFNRGHSTATGASNERIERLTEELTAARTAATEAQARIRTLETGQPDFEAERTQYREQIRDLTEQRDEARRTGDERVRAMHTNLAQAELRRMLVEDHGVDPVYAETLAERNARRVTVKLPKGDSGDAAPEIIVMQRDKTIPIADENPLGALAKELRAGITDPRWITSNGGSGSGTGGSRDGGAGGDSTSGEALAKKKAKEFQEARDRAPNPLAPRQAPATV